MNLAVLLRVLLQTLIWQVVICLNSALAFHSQKLHMKCILAYSTLVNQTIQFPCYHSSCY
jgi:hypothetical protein